MTSPIELGDPRLPARFWAKVNPCPMTGCWLWNAALNGDGYGGFRLSRPRRMTSSHRISYETLAGTVSVGLQLDHLCRVRSCCNPAHLQPVTVRENLLRGIGFAAVHAARTHCPSGHPYEGENLYILRGRRHCRICSSASATAATARRRVLGRR